MDTSGLTELLQQAADEQPDPAPAPVDRVTARAHGLRRRRRISAVVVAVVSSAAIAGGIVAVEFNTHPSETVSIAPPGGSGRQSGAWRIDAAGLAVLHDYAEPSGEISAVSQVQMKETNWASYVFWARNTPGDLPLSAGYTGSGDTTTPIFSSSTLIYVIAQTGVFNCNAIYGCDGRNYNWVMNIIKVGDPPGGGLIFASPTSVDPPSMTALPGPSATLDTQTGQTSMSTAPAPGIPMIAVPSVVGLTVGTAVTRLQGVGFSTLGPNHSAIQMGPLDQRHITSQDPAAGFLAPAGSAVTLTLSS